MDNVEIDAGKPTDGKARSLAIGVIARGVFVPLVKELVVLIEPAGRRVAGIGKTLSRAIGFESRDQGLRVWQQRNAFLRAFRGGAFLCSTASRLAVVIFSYRNRRSAVFRLIVAKCAHRPADDVTRQNRED